MSLDKWHTAIWSIFSIFCVHTGITHTQPLPIILVKSTMVQSTAANNIHITAAFLLFMFFLLLANHISWSLFRWVVCSQHKFGPVKLLTMHQCSELGPSRFFSVQVKSQVSISNFKSSHKSNASLTNLCKYKSSQIFFSKSSHKYLTWFSSHLSSCCVRCYPK